MNSSEEIGSILVGPSEKFTTAESATQLAKEVSRILHALTADELAALSLDPSEREVITVVAEPPGKSLTEWLLRIGGPVASHVLTQLWDEYVVPRLPPSKDDESE